MNDEARNTASGVSRCPACGYPGPGPGPDAPLETGNTASAVMADVTRLVEIEELAREIAMQLRPYEPISEAKVREQLDDIKQGINLYLKDRAASGHRGSVEPTGDPEWDDPETRAMVSGVVDRITRADLNAEYTRGRAEGWDAALAHARHQGSADLTPWLRHVGECPYAGMNLAPSVREVECTCGLVQALGATHQSGVDDEVTHRCIWRERYEEVRAEVLARTKPQPFRSSEPKA
jgi:hypothetical protein